MHNRKGSVSFALISVSAIIFLVVAISVFVIEMMIQIIMINEVKETLKVAGIETCQTIDRIKLGSGVLSVSITTAQSRFCSSLLQQLATRPHITIQSTPAVNISITQNIITIDSSVSIITKNNRVISIKNCDRFLTE